MPKRKVDETPYGEKMLVVELRFFTNDLGRKDGRVRPKHAWSGGMARLRANPSHGIEEEGTKVPFYTLLGIPGAVEKLLVRRGITIHASPKERKYRA